MEGSIADVGERAVPFREGEEVLVTLVEPHMYNVDDAVAKIDGYIVSVAGGGPFVGQKHLVRIEEPGRTSARATMVDPPPAPPKRAPANGAPKNDAKTVRRAARTTRPPAAPKPVVDGVPEAIEKAPQTGENGDALESKPRRRGRRGGRRRSAAAADSGTGTETTSE